MMSDRRGFLVRSGLALAATVGGANARAREAAAAARRQPFPRLDTWEDVRAQFALTDAFLHFGGLYIASHPAPVRRAIEQHRLGMDENPVHYLQDRGPGLEAAVLGAAAGYLGVDPVDIALTDSTTMGLGLLYNGVDLRAGDEALTTRHDFSATHESLRLKADRSGATVRMVALYDEPQDANEEAIVQAIAAAVTPRTRVVAVTWVHSSTGVKLPISALAGALAELNAGRSPAERALLCVDGVHGLGVEDVTLPDLGADAFVAGCHKWLFGPRGTGFVWARPEVWPRLQPTIASFTPDRVPGGLMTPGGFHSFEHRWALGEAFAFHRQIGKPRVQERIHALNHQLKDGLASLAHVTLYTPRSDSLSAGLVCFDVQGLRPREVVQRLRERGIVATTTPYNPTYARLAPSLLNSPDEVDRALAEIRALA